MSDIFNVITNFYAFFSNLLNRLSFYFELVLVACLMIAILVAPIHAVWKEVCLYRRLPPLRFFINWIGYGAAGGAAVPIFFIFSRVLFAHPGWIHLFDSISLLVISEMFSVAVQSQDASILSILLRIGLGGGVVGAIYVCIVATATYAVWRCINWKESEMEESK